jgi:hypothetical protein
MDLTMADAETYLRSLLNQTLRVTTSDTRLFVGEFKCTDAVSYSPNSPHTTYAHWAFEHLHDIPTNDCRGTRNET